MFSIVNAVLIRALPYPNADRLVMLWGNVKRAVVERRGASYPDFVDWRSRSKSFEAMAACWDNSFTLYGGDEPQRVSGEVVSASYFSVLGVSAKLGRTFRPEEDLKPDANLVAVVGEGLWKRRFGGDPRIVGQHIQLDQRLFTIIGVAPASFRGMSDQAEIWVPVMASGLGQTAGERGTRFFPAVARLKPGITRVAAQAEMTGVARQLELEHPDTNEKRGVEVAPLNDEFTGDIRPVLLVLLAAVGFVLLIACANVANLLLVRAEGRRREMAIRTALGAGRLRLLRQLLIESCTLTMFGAAAGVLASYWGVDALLALSPIELPSFTNVRVDLSVVLFTAGISVATAIALGLAPALSGGKARIHDALKETAARTTATRARQRFRSALVVAELALAMVLLVGAGLFMRTFSHLNRLDPGFRAEGLLSMSLSLPRLAQPAMDNSTADAQTVSAARRIRDAVQSIPGVEEVALSSDIPLSGSESAIFYTAEGQPPVTAQNMPRAYAHRVTPRFFRTLGIRLLSGRDFSPEEMEGRAPAIIVSQDVATRFWPGQDAIGKRIKSGRPNSRGPWLSIVGVVQITNYRGIPRNPTADADLFFPFNERSRSFDVMVRSGVEPSRLISAVRSNIRSAESSAVLFGIMPMTERVERQLARARFASWMMATFAASALLLALVGIYAVMAYLVTQRTQEIGVRVALGATAANVVAMVTARAAVLVAAGIAIGALGGVALSRFIASMLYGVESSDPFVLLSVALLLAGAALLATWAPARRAVRVDPLKALRYE
jgi:predicted permease